MKTRLTLIAALLASTSLQALELKSADVHNSDDYPTVAAVKHLGQVLAKSSGGALTVKVFNKGALGSEKETIDQVKLGALAMTRVNLGPLSAMCPKTLVPALPFLFRDTAHMRKAYDGAPGEEILKACEHQGMVGLALYDSGARSVYARKPIKTLADMKGLKIRVQQTDLWVAAMQAMGANPSPMPIGEVYTGLKTNLIDAAENNIPSYEGFRHFEAAKFYSRTEHSMTPDALFISKKVWDKLKPEQQAQLRAAAKASVVVQREKWDAQEAKALAVVKAGGAQIVDADREPLRQAVQPVIAKFVNTPDLQKLVKAIQDIK
ncbi:TRAP transporter substrate-binding protein [Roseateles asaccharophilus]|uniref:Tripartite ATP-independent transporter DctP family solute receptor n=1 Tax=Roseateles asaccharophilus TaxID=582607 RepID=A0ABU2AFE0_9BURK|nr:TRAP transporter substrate-binding protein [Roseateles asaccharophilus]MDR7335912.1 tripartite ATP-independent transporter DctP family solute receptor [Roseateles asaccharophilus]